MRQLRLVLLPLHGERAVGVKDQRRRRRALAKLLDDLESLRAVLGRVQSGDAAAADTGENYTSFADLEHVKAAPTVSAFDDEGH